MLPWEVPRDVIASFQGMFVWMQGLDKVGVPEEYKADLLATGRTQHSLRGRTQHSPRGITEKSPRGRPLCSRPSPVQPQPVQAQAQAQPQPLHMDTAPVAQVVQPEAQVGTVVLETACSNDSSCRCDLARDRHLAVITT